MNPIPPNIITPSLLNRAFVYSGVARFARLYMAQPSPIFEQLEVYADLATLLGLPAGEWEAAIARLAQHAPQLPDPFGQLLRDYQLQIHEWFVLALCGETEASHLLNLALAELQSPTATPRPGLHLLEAMAQALFDAPLPPLALPSHRLVRAGVLEISGDGPLPTRQLTLPPVLWALLCGDSTPWPGVRPLLPGRAALPGEDLHVFPCGIIDQDRHLAAYAEGAHGGNAKGEEGGSPCVCGIPALLQHSDPGGRGDGAP